MSNVVNLRQMRKQKARADKAKAGDQAAAKHGRTKAEKSKSDALASMDAKRLDGHKRET